MVEGTRADMRRIDQEQNTQYKHTLAFVIFLLVSLVMITTTFLNPLFMKGQIRRSFNQAVVVRQMNTHFDRLAYLIGANPESDSNLLTVQQTQPIADHVIDYTVGLHGFDVNSYPLALNILKDINQNIDQGSSSDAQKIRQRLKKMKGNAPSFVQEAFDLNVVMLGANLALLLLIVNLIIIIVTVITLISLLRDMKIRSSNRALVHDVTAAGMWAGFWLILICGLLSLIPILFNVESWQLGDLGYLFEIGSGIFLDFVIAGVIIYIICAIPWQATTAE